MTEEKKPPKGLTTEQELRLWRELTMLLPHNFEECNSPPWSQIEDHIKKLEKVKEAFDRESGKVAGEVLRQLEKDGSRVVDKSVYDQMQRIDYYARKVYKQLEENAKNEGVYNTPTGLEAKLWENFGRALFDGTWQPHEVSPASTHEEVMASDNKVIKDAYEESRVVGEVVSGTGGSLYYRDRRSGHTYSIKKLDIVNDEEPVETMFGKEFPTPRADSARPVLKVKQDFVPKTVEWPSPQKPLDKLVQKALNVARLPDIYMTQDQQLVDRTIGELRKAAGEYEAEQKKQESFPDEWYVEACAGEIVDKAVKVYRVRPIQFGPQTQPFYRAIQDLLESVEEFERVRRGRIIDDAHHEKKSSAPESPGMFQRLMCAGGKHEPEGEKYAQTPYYDLSLKVNGWAGHFKVRKCKHCKCLYVEEK